VLNQKQVGAVSDNQDKRKGQTGPQNAIPNGRYGTHDGALQTFFHHNAVSTRPSIENWGSGSTA
jgi:hypothetical protein